MLFSLATATISGARRRNQSRGVANTKPNKVFAITDYEEADKL